MCKILLYHYQYTASPEYTMGTHIKNVFDGTWHKELVASGQFQDPRDVALMASRMVTKFFSKSVMTVG